MIYEKTLNPYLNIYQNLNIDIANNHISKEIAELIAVQIGLVHNTLGIILKDLVKILENKFSQPNNLTNKLQIENKTHKNKQQTGRKQVNQLNVIPQTSRINHFKKIDLLIQKKPEHIIEQQNSVSKINSRQSVSVQSSNQNAKKFKQKKKSLTRESMQLDGEDSKRTSINQKFQMIQNVRNNNQSIEITEFNIQNQSKRLFPELLVQTNDFKQQYSVPIRYTRKNNNNSKVPLKGVNCVQCNKFYEATKDISINKLCECSSRHRTNFPQTKIPQYSQLFEI